MPVQTKTDINRASREELIAIDGIGETMADAIIRFREQNGDFKSLEDLDKVPGIGESRIEYIKSTLSVGESSRSRRESESRSSQSQGQMRGRESQSRQGSQQSSQSQKSSSQGSEKEKSGSQGHSKR